MASAAPISSGPSTLEGRAEQQPSEAVQLFRRAVVYVASARTGGQADIPPKLFEDNTDLTRSFCQELVSTIKASLSTISAHSRQRAREKALSRFHQLRVATLPDIWMRIAAQLACPPTKAAVMQAINRFIFCELLLKHFSCIDATQQHETSIKEWKDLFPDEEMAVRYASGFVTNKLMKTFMKKRCHKARQFVECLSHMAIDGDETSFLQYTRTWSQAVNRGGLFEVSEATFLFFKSIELKTQNVLPMYLRCPAESSKKQLLDCIVQDENVQVL